MYDSKQLYRKEKAENVKRSAAGNRTGIPGAIKAQYEAASGLSFDDVRIHYNSRKPEKLQALAYTQGNHVYMGPGQEKYLRHELGHVVQQKRGMVRPNMRINGLPVNTDRRLEQQADQGVVPMHGGNGGYSRVPLEDIGEDPGLVRRYVPESTENTIQGMFLRWETVEGNIFLTEVGRGERYDYDTAVMSPENVFGLMRDILDDDLIRKLSGEMNVKLYQAVTPDETQSILEFFSDDLNAAGRIISALDDDCFNWLLTALNNSKISAKSRNGIKECVSRRLKQKDAPGNRSYLELRDQINGLAERMNFVRGMPEQTDYEKNRKAQLLQLLRWELRGYSRLLEKFPADRILQDLQGMLNNLEHDAGGIVPELDSAAAVPLPSPGDRYAVTYAAQESQKVLMPALGELSGVITDDEPVRRGGDRSITDLAKDILAQLDRTKGRDRLVIYRGMDGVEALSILQFFNSSKAKEVEDAINNDGSERHFDVHEPGNFAKLGKHYGENVQAEKYSMVQDQTHDRQPNYANVLLAFVLKPGAKELLFSKSLLALPDSDLIERRVGFAEASRNEGLASGYIGVKAERIEGSGTFSLGVSQNIDTQILLQLLVDRVEVKRILYKRDPRKKETAGLSAGAGA